MVSIDTAWERAPVTELAKLSLWRVEWRLYSLLDDKLWDLGRQLPEYYGDEDPSELGYGTKQRLKAEAWEKFLNMDMFFVKVTISHSNMQKCEKLTWYRCRILCILSPTYRIFVIFVSKLNTGNFWRQKHKAGDGEHVRSGSRIRILLGTTDLLHDASTITMGLSLARINPNSHKQAVHHSSTRKFLDADWCKCCQTTQIILEYA